MKHDDGGFQQAAYLLRGRRQKPRSSRSRAEKTFWRRIHTGWYHRQFVKKYGTEPLDDADETEKA